MSVFVMSVFIMSVSPNRRDDYCSALRAEQNVCSMFWNASESAQMFDVNP